MARRSQLALYPGSFDPFTFGHLDVLERAARLFEEVEITVAINFSKDTLFSAEERCQLARQCTSHVENVTVAAFEGLLVERARDRNAQVLVRGLRQVSDFDYEFRMAFANRKMHQDLETIFLMTSEEYALVSSTIVRDVYRWEGEVSKFVPEPVVKALRKKRRKQSP